MPIKTPFLLISLISLSLLSGCAAVVVGGATTGVAIAHDRRSTGTVIDDQTIELKALKIMYSNALIRRNSHINVTCYNGLLLLTGEAPTDSLRQTIVQSIRVIPGIKKIHQAITIAAPSALVSRTSDAYVTSKVKVSLFNLNHISGFDPTRVKVTTEDGVVYLLGLLKPHEISPVVDTIRRVGGVQRVVQLFETMS